MEPSTRMPLLLENGAWDISDDMRASCPRTVVICNTLTPSSVRIHPEETVTYLLNLLAYLEKDVHYLTASVDLLAKSFGESH